MIEYRKWIKDTYSNRVAQWHYEASLAAIANAAAANTTAVMNINYCSTKRVSFNGLIIFFLNKIFKAYSLTLKKVKLSKKNIFEFNFEDTFKNCK